MPPAPEAVDRESANITGLRILIVEDSVLLALELDGV